MSVEVTQEGKKVTFGFCCPLCGQEWRADAITCNMIGVDEENNPSATMACENCGSWCDSTNFLKEDK